MTAGPRTVRLDPESVEAVARRVAELLAERPAPGLVDAAAVAAALGVSRDTVYEHAAALGARRLGHGRRGRLRFDLEEAVAAWAACHESRRPEEPEKRAAPRNGRPRQAARTGAGAELLPVRPPAGAQAAARGGADEQVRPTDKEATRG